MLKTELPHVVGRARGKIALLARQVAQRITRRHAWAGVEVRGSSSGLLQLRAQMQELQMRLKRLGDLPGGGEDHAVRFAAADRHQNRLDASAIKYRCCAAGRLVWVIRDRLHVHPLLFPYEHPSFRRLLHPYLLAAAVQALWGDCYSMPDPSSLKAAHRLYGLSLHGLPRTRITLPVRATAVLRGKPQYRRSPRRAKDRQAGIKRINTDGAADMQTQELSSFDFTHLRDLMVDRQIASRGVRSKLVLDAMRSVPREAFLPERYVGIRVRGLATAHRAGSDDLSTVHCCNDG